MPLLKDGAVGETEASSPHEIAKTAAMTRSRPRNGVVVIESSGTEAGSATPVPVWLWWDISRWVNKIRRMEAARITPQMAPET
jgi:hypothetical protein